MKKLSVIGLFLGLILLTACGLGPDYNLALNPPGANDKPEDIFPAKIGEDEPNLNPLEFGGLECMYGSDKSITVARLSSKEEAIAYFKQNLQPTYKSQNSNFSGTINGQFYAKASGDWKLFGWVNENWTFSIKATDKKSLNEIVDAFKFIERK